MSDTKKLPELFGSLVFNEETMKERLSSASYSAWKKSVTDGTSLGGRKGRYPLYPLVSAHDRLHRGKARQLYLSRRRR